MAKVAADVGSTANRYQILAKLAVGGMAEIFLARGASVAGVERYCVLKRILRERASDAQFVRMFVDEARLASQLQHPNIASVYDVGVLGDSYFFTMEYVHGETVRSLLHCAEVLQRSLPLACVLTITAGAAAGLHHAHERKTNDGQPLGIVHRDVSPSNLIVSFEGNVKLVDFGVAKADDRAVETRSGTVKGKISYLSPEQCRGERVDRRSDLFSLGIVMWEMLTGKRLYRRASDFENMTAIVNELPPPPSSHRPEVPRAVDDIVLRLLAKSVADRFQTADEVIEAIENASMRAGMMLSTSAVGRLVRDLFGHRPEPWLEIERATGPHEPVSLASRPIPEGFEPAPPDDSDEDDLGLSSVLDLSVIPTNELDELEDRAALPEARAEEPPAARPRRMTHPTPTPPAAAIPIAVPAMPSAPHPTIAPAAQIARPSAGALDTTLRAAPAIPANTTLLDAAPPIPLSTTLVDPAPPVPANTTLLGISAPPSATASPFSVFPSMTVLRAQTAPPVHAAAAPGGSPVNGPYPTHDPSLSAAELPASASGPMPVLGSSPRPAPNLPGFGTWSPAPVQVRAPRRPTSRINWLLITVIVIAATTGVAVVWLLMKAGGRSTPQKAADAALPTADAGGSAGRIDARGASEADAEIIAFDAGSEGVPVAQEAPADAPTPPPDTQEPEPSGASLPPRHDPPPRARPPSTTPAQPPVATGPTPRPKPPAAGNSGPSAQALHELFNKDQYSEIVRICSGASLKTEIGRVCLLAACREGNATQAKRWLAATERAVHDQLVNYCKTNGNLDLSR